MVPTIGGHHGTEWDSEAGQGKEAKEAKEAEQEEVEIESLAREKLPAFHKLFETPAGIEQDDEPMFAVEDKLPKLFGEYLARWHENPGHWGVLGRRRIVAGNLTDSNDEAEDAPPRGRPPSDQTVKALREQIQALEQKVDLMGQALQEYVENPVVVGDQAAQHRNGEVPGLAALQAALRDDPKFHQDMLLKAELIDQKVGGHLQQFVMALYIQK